MKDRRNGYICFILVLGAMSGLALFTQWTLASPLQFLTYLALALLTSGWKVSLPGIPGTLSANFLYVLLSILELSLGESLLLGGLSVLVQYAWKARSRFQFSKAAFNVASIWIAITWADSVIHSSALQSWHFALPFRIVLGTCAYFLGNTLSISLAIAATSGKSGLQTWRDCYVWSFPYYLVGGALARCINLVDMRWGWQTSVLIAPVIYIVYRSYSLYFARLQAEKAQAEAQRQHADEIVGLHLRTIEALALAIDAKDETTHEHLQRVQVYSLEMGKLLGLSQEELKALQAASLLHDIGKLAVPEHILSKPGKLTPEEFEKVKIHPVVGAEILERVKFPYPVVPIVRHHHEAWDGSGYPDGLKGLDIPIGARILSVVDCLDALASDRQYRKAMQLDDAMNVVRSESGKRYDPDIVKLLSDHYKALEQKARESSLDLRLHRNIRVDRGMEPAAGFGLSVKSKPHDFIHSIGAARREAQLVFEMTQALVKSLSLPEMLSPLAQRLKELIPFDSMAVYVIRQEVLFPAFVTGQDADQLDTLSIPMGQGLSGWVAETRSPIINGNPAVEPGYQTDARATVNLRSALAVPLEGSNGVLGTISLYSTQTETFAQEHLRILLSVTSRLGLAIENSVRFRRVEDEAATDFLTGLHNARSLFDRLRADVEEAIREGKSFTVMICDLDRFKDVNDRFGHLAGNQVLQTVAAVLQRHCRQKDYAGRMGGDEFVLALQGLEPPHAEILAGRLREAVAEAAASVISGSDFSMSVGWACVPQDGSRVDDLLAEADRKMYVDKEQRGHKTDLSRLVAAVGTHQPSVPERAPR